MAKLTTKQRNAMSPETFALPRERKYPLNDASHARNALARVSEFGTPAEKAEVREKVHEHYPGIGAGKKRGGLRRVADRMRGR